MRNVSDVQIDVHVEVCDSKRFQGGTAGAQRTSVQGHPVWPCMTLWCEAACKNHSNRHGSQAAAAAAADMVGHGELSHHVCSECLPRVEVVGEDVSMCPVLDIFGNHMVRDSMSTCTHGSIETR